MTQVTLRPAATVSNTGWVVTGTSFDAALADDSPATFVDAGDGVEAAGVAEVDAFVIAADDRIKAARYRISAVASGDASSVALRLLTPNGQNSVVSRRLFVVDTLRVYETGWLGLLRELSDIDLASGLRTSLGHSELDLPDNPAVTVDELFIDIDVRSRPVVDSASTVTTQGGVPTYTVQFTYDTSTFWETVQVTSVVVDNSTGQVRETIETEVSGADFAAETVVIDSTLDSGALAAGTYTVTHTVTAFGFNAGPATFPSEPHSSEFQVLLAGVPEPLVDCEIDPVNQSVIVHVEQPTDIAPTGSCMTVRTAEPVAYTGGLIPATSIPATDPRHVTFWQDNVQVTLEYTLTAVSVDLEAQDVVPASGSIDVVIAEETVAADAAFFATQVEGPGTVIHGLNSTDLIVQMLDTTGEQAVGAVTISTTNAIEIGENVPPGVRVLVVAPATDEVCMISSSVPVPPGNNVIGHQYAQASILATLVDETGLAIWAGMRFEPFQVEIDNPTAATWTLHLNGAAATFDDPYQVRIEMRRDPGDLLLPFDGQGRVACPNTVVDLVDRFAPRCSTSCAGDCGTPPTYQVRLYGDVEGSPATSAWVSCSPGCIDHDGQGWVRHPSDPELDWVGCVASQPWTRSRPFEANQPLGGGIPFVRTGDLSGRNYSLTFPVRSWKLAAELEAALASQLVFYQPVDSCAEGVWLAGQGLAVDDVPMRQPRPHVISQDYVEVEPEPVVLPYGGFDESCPAP